jgi:hypothetical protein
MRRELLKTSNPHKVVELAKKWAGVVKAYIVDANHIVIFHRESKKAKCITPSTD